uniref:Uncharacterized protein n=1 Tax=Oryza punctata TaxID=4537 RepID=A0A0E0L1C8_ORYPU
MVEKSVEHIYDGRACAIKAWVPVLLIYSHRLLNYIASSSSSNNFYYWASPMLSDVDHFASHCEYLHTLHRRLKCHVGLLDTTRMASIGVWVIISGHFKLSGTRHFLENV